MAYIPTVDEIRWEGAMLRDMVKRGYITVEDAILKLVTDYNILKAYAKYNNVPYIANKLEAYRREIQKLREMEQKAILWRL